MFWNNEMNQPTKSLMTCTEDFRLFLLEFWLIMARF